MKNCSNLHTYLYIYYGPRFFKSEYGSPEAVTLAHPYSLFIFFNFHLYMHPTLLQKSVGGPIVRIFNYPNRLPDIPRYCFQLLYFVFLVFLNRYD